MACVSVRRMDFDRQGMVYHHPPGFAALCLKCYKLLDMHPATMAIIALGDGSLAFFPPLLTSDGTSTRKAMSLRG